MKRLCTWVTADGTAAVLSTVVRSTHQSRGAAERSARAAREFGLEHEAVSAQVMQLMQAGKPYTSAIQAVAGLAVAPVFVEVADPPTCNGCGRFLKLTEVARHESRCDSCA